MRIIAGRVMLTDFNYRSDLRYHGQLLLIYDSITECYTWEFRRAPDTGPPTLPQLIGDALLVYSRSQAMTTVSLQSPHIVMRDAMERANSLDDVEAKVIEILSRAGERLIIDGFERKVTRIPFHDLGQDFFTPFLGPVSGAVKLIDVTRLEHEWRITVRGQWDEQIVLDDDYQIKQKIQLSEPAPRPDLKIKSVKPVRLN